MARKVSEQTNLLLKVRGQTIWFQRCVKGELCRYSSGYKNTPQNVAYLKKNGEAKFWEEYNKAHDIDQAATYSFNFNEYGKYALEVSAGNRKDKQQKNVLSKLEAMSDYFGSFEIQDISTSVIAKWQTLWQKGQWSPPSVSIGGKKAEIPSEKTILNYRGVLSTVLEMAVADGIIAKNPLEYVKAPKVGKRIVETYSELEIKAILANTDEVFGDMIRFALWTGMRPSELIALRWHNINVQSGYILVKEGTVEGVTDTTKNGNDRIAEILPQLQATVLRQMRRTNLRSEFVFLNQYGKPYQATKAIQTKFQKVCLAANVRIGEFYDLKRTFVTWMRQNGQSDVWLTQQVGHADAKTTNVYTGRITPNLDGIKALKAV